MMIIIIYFKNTILKEEIDSKYRLCKQREGNIDHLTSGCPILATYDKVCAHLRYSVSLPREVLKKPGQILSSVEYNL
jgi:hypothetical protein